MLARRIFQHFFTGTVGACGMWHKSAAQDETSGSPELKKLFFARSKPTIKYRGWGSGPRGFVFLAMLFLLLLVNITLRGQGPVSKEYQVKALFLYNFTQFVQWPPQAFIHDAAPLVIGILGEDPFGSYIDELVSEEVINNHPLVVKRYTSIEEVGDCHLLYINLNEKDQIAGVLEALRNRPILTVSDADNFAKIGGMIRFIRDDEHIRLRINTTAVAEAQLVVSSKLLRLSEILTGKNN